MKTTFRKTMLAAAALLICQAASASASPSFVAVTWNDQAVHLLDSGMNDLSSFQVNNSLPNGVAASSSLIYAGNFTTQSISAYNFSGALQFSWSDSRLSNLQGLALVGNDLVVASNGNSYFFDAATGAYHRQFSNSGDTVEGLTYDGKYLWEIGDTLIARDVNTGAQVASISNAAIGCDFGGTGMAGAGSGALMLACTSGQWYKVSSADGSVLSSGNNGLNMYGLDSIAAVPEPESYAMLLAGVGLIGCLARRRRHAA